jgi:hypothetical protein
MGYFLDAINIIPHAEEAAKRLSRTTHGADAVSLFGRLPISYTLASGNPGIRAESLAPGLRWGRHWTPAFRGGDE